MSSMGHIPDGAAQQGTQWSTEAFNQDVQNSPSQGVQTPQGTVDPNQQSTIATAGGPPDQNIGVQDQQPGNPNLPPPNQQQQAQQSNQTATTSQTDEATATSETQGTQETQSGQTTQTQGQTDGGAFDGSPSSVIGSIMTAGQEQIVSVLEEMSPEMLAELEEYLIESGAMEESGMGTYSKDGGPNLNRLAQGLMNAALKNSQTELSGDYDTNIPSNVYGDGEIPEGTFDMSAVDWENANVDVDPDSPKAQQLIAEFKEATPGFENMSADELASAMDSFINQQLSAMDPPVDVHQAANMKASAMIGMMNEAGFPAIAQNIEVIVGVNNFNGLGEAVVSLTQLNGDRVFFGAPGGTLPLGAQTQIAGFIPYATYNNKEVAFHKTPQQTARLTFDGKEVGGALSSGDVNHLAVVAMVLAMVAMLIRLISSEDMDALDKEAGAIQGDFEANLLCAEEKAKEMQEMLEKREQMQALGIFAAIAAAIIAIVMTIGTLGTAGPAAIAVAAVVISVAITMCVFSCLEVSGEFSLTKEMSEGMGISEDAARGIQMLILVLLTIATLGGAAGGAAASAAGQAASQAAVQAVKEAIRVGILQVALQGLMVMAPTIQEAIAKSLQESGNEDAEMIAMIITMLLMIIAMIAGAGAQGAANTGAKTADAGADAATATAGGSAGAVAGAGSKSAAQAASNAAKKAADVIKEAGDEVMDTIIDALKSMLKKLGSMLKGGADEAAGAGTEAAEGGVTTMNQTLTRSTSAWTSAAPSTTARATADASVDAGTAAVQNTSQGISIGGSRVPSSTTSTLTEAATDGSTTAAVQGGGEAGSDIAEGSSRSAASGAGGGTGSAVAGSADDGANAATQAAEEVAADAAQEAFARQVESLASFISGIVTVALGVTMVVSGLHQVDIAQHQHRIDDLQALMDDLSTRAEMKQDFMSRLAEGQDQTNQYWTSVLKLVASFTSDLSNMIKWT